MMHVFLIAAQTIDGFIATQADQVSTAWTSQEDKKWFNQRTKEAGVIVMGRTTYDTIGRPLPGRLNVVYTRTLPQDGTVKEGLVFTQDNLAYTSLQPEELIVALKKVGYSEVAICGGASVYTQFLKSGVVDTMYLTIEPVIFGQGVKLFAAGLEAKPELKGVTQLSTQTIVLEYSLK